MKMKNILWFPLLIAISISVSSCDLYDWFTQKEDFEFISYHQTDSAELYDGYAGIYHGVVCIKKNGSDEILDTISVCQTRFGDHTDKKYYCTIPVSGFARAASLESDKQVLSLVTDSIHFSQSYRVLLYGVGFMLQKRVLEPQRFLSNFTMGDTTITISFWAYHDRFEDEYSTKEGFLFSMLKIAINGNETPLITDDNESEIILIGNWQKHSINRINTEPQL